MTAPENVPTKNPLVKLSAYPWTVGYIALVSTLVLVLALIHH